MKQEQVISQNLHQMIEDAMPLVGWTIRRYFKCNEGIVGLSYEDLFQEGCIALCRAASEYDKKRGAFNTFAVTVIHHYLIDYCRMMTGPTRNLPSVSLEQLAEEGWTGAGSDADKAFESEDESLSTINTQDFLRKRKDRYAGSAKLGVEALELKVLGGYGITDIAKQYDAEPNLVGAWIAKAKKRIRLDISPEELDGFGVEKAS